MKMSVDTDTTLPGGMAASDLSLGNLFTELVRILPTARSGPSLTKLRKILSDIGFELAKYEKSATLSVDSWIPRLDNLIDVLQRIQIPAAILLEIKDIENDLVNTIEVFLKMTSAQGNLELIKLQLELSEKCTSVQSLPRVRAFGYWKSADLRRNVPTTPQSVSVFIPVIVSLLNGLRDDDGSVSKSAADSMILLIQHFSITNILQSSFAFAKRLQEVIDSTTLSGSRDIVRFRVFELLRDLLKLNLATVADFVQLGLMEHLYSSFRSMDLLVLTNCCEALNQFAEFSQGLDLLEQSGGMTLAEEMLTRKMDSPEYSYFAPYMLRVFTTIGVKFPEYCIVKREAVTLVARRLITDLDDYSAAASLEYIGQLAASSVAGKRYLRNLHTADEGRFMTPVLRLIGNAMKDQRTTNLPPVNEQSFRTARLLLRKLPASSVETDEEVQKISADWFEGMENVFPSLFAKARNPFMEVKLPVLRILLEMASQRWGQEKFRDEPGFVEYLLNRQLESDKESKELKFEIIRAVISTPVFVEVFDSRTGIRFREYVQDGPFYVRAEHQVASEST